MNQVVVIYIFIYIYIDIYVMKPNNLDHFGLQICYFKGKSKDPLFCGGLFFCTISVVCLILYVRWIVNNVQFELCNRWIV